MTTDGPGRATPSPVLGGKEAWVAQAVAQVLSRPVLLALYGPATPDAAMVSLSCSPALLTRIEVTLQDGSVAG